MGVDPLADRLADVVGRAHAVVDRDVLAGMETDWTGRFRGRARLAVRPGSLEELCGVLALCHDQGVAVVPQGGNTGLVGGSVPLHGEVLLSTVRLDRLEPVDERAGQVVAGAGVTMAAVQRHARAAGWALGVDWGARDTATVGGMVATNGGGIRALRYGTVRGQVAGLEAVLADGRVVSRMSGLLKDTAGFDLPALIVGSEGALAVIARARLRLVPHLPARVVALVGLGGVQEAVALLTVLRERVPSLDAVEFMLRDGLELVCAHARLPDPFTTAHPVYVLIECAGHTDPIDELAAALDDISEVREVAVAEDAHRRERLWAYRERHTEAVASLGVVHKLDVSVPVGALPAFTGALPAMVKDVAPRARLVLFGHLADGNVHVQVVGPSLDDGCVDEAVLRLVAAHGGSISAEHGVGTAKARFLHLTRSAEEIAAMRAIKQALDPRGILNPHAVLPASAGAPGSMADGG